MKRLDRTERDILADLKEQGLTQSDIAKKLGIAPRTLRSYAASFGGYRGSKSSRTPPEKVLKKLRSLGQRRNIRTTRDVVPSGLYEVYIKYKFERETGNGPEKGTRDKILFFPAFELEDLTNKQMINLLIQEITTVYMVTSGNFRVKIKIIDWTARKQIIN
jgi:transcriptional regulator with XRE-family HTH domain